MYLIVGLGNPGDAFKWTRHNVGFELIEKLAFDNNISSYKLKHKAIIYEGKISEKKVLFVKPITYMNLSGESVIQICKYYEIPIENIIIVHDEIALNVGTIKIKYGGSSGGHNGISSIINSLKTNYFLRLRIGVGSKPKDFNLSDYVLSKFLKEEHGLLLESLDKATEAIRHILIKGKDSAMNLYNKKTTEI
ncbi:MAG: aminoacyl-tRNA hydrolase [Defluviitaleaceae bacterium]|nr:aminoacyl-tRNA hydrolase [Defluviitaleaceae bacterium]